MFRCSVVCHRHREEFAKKKEWKRRNEHLPISKHLFFMLNTSRMNGKMCVHQATSSAQNLQIVCDPEPELIESNVSRKRTRLKPFFRVLKGLSERINLLLLGFFFHSRNKKFKYIHTEESRLGNGTRTGAIKHLFNPLNDHLSPFFLLLQIQ